MVWHYNFVALEVSTRVEATDGQDHAFHRNQITRRLRLVTPCFSAGADNPTEEIRLPALLGMIRMWWRAAEAQHISTSRKETHLRLRESKLFGAAASETSSDGQGRFLAALATEGEQPCQKANSELDPDLAIYVGQGGANRTRFLSPQPEGTGNFVLTLAFKRAATDTDKQQIQHALERWLLLGGLGLGSRRGFGSFAHVGAGRPMPEPTMPEPTMPERLKAVLLAKRPTPRPFPIFSDRSWVKCRQFVGISPQAALAQHAECLHQFAQTYTESGVLVLVNSQYAKNFHGEKKKDKSLSSDDIFSDQIIDLTKGSRQPSPIHVHAAPSEGGASVICTYLPTTNISTTSAVERRINAFFTAHSDYETVWP